MLYGKRTSQVQVVAHAAQPNLELAAAHVLETAWVP